MPPIPPKEPVQRRIWTTLLLIGSSIALIAFWQMGWSDAGAHRLVSYSEFLTLADKGQLKSVEIDPEQVIGRLMNEQKPSYVVAERIPQQDGADLVRRLEAAKVEVRGKPASTWWQHLWLLPLVLILLSSLRGSIGTPGKGPLTFGRSRVKLYNRGEGTRVTFEDVAGVDEAENELGEVVGFLRTPEKYRALGARIPKGVLLLGPPGTGKTLLARAVAGEADVAFFSLSGSDFVEMFVGVGAARVRDLFEQAKASAPCIVFIDELDAIGKSRGGLTAMGSNEEREQTLNQLLVEMDGFDSSSGVVIMAATNRPEILDPALVRAGRFDRQVLVDRPDLAGREAILQVHAKNLKLGQSANLHVIAQRTPGMVGADLANVLNEAAITAARRGSLTVEQEDLEDAIDRVQLGLKKKGHVMTPAEKRRVAFHESGHTVAALSLEHANPVHRVSIIARSIGALGVTLQLPTEERYLMTETELRDQLCVMLAGRAAEQLVFGVVSTGAQDDLERATETARQMVCRFGMDEVLGPLSYGRARGLRFLGLGEQETERNYSEQTAQGIDVRIQSIIESEYARARDLLEKKRSLLDAVAERLLEVETLDAEALSALRAGTESGLQAGAPVVKPRAVA